jgi:DnaK suppressor protein
MTLSNAQLVSICKEKLLETKSRLMSQLGTISHDLFSSDRSRGDESDLASAHQEEHQFLITHSRIKQQIQEIEMALGRIESGSYGVCEETSEPIEPERLLALPWTRYSIEGAEIREDKTAKKGSKRRSS